MKTVTVKPSRKGLRVVGPDRVVLPPEGAPVELTPFWLRRMRCGDVVEVGQGSEPTNPPQSKTTPPKKA